MLWETISSEMAMAAPRGTEVAVFLTSRDGMQTEKLLYHVRPDNSTAQVLDDAIAAFREIVAPCLIADKNGAIQIQDGTDPPQFCLVVIMRFADLVRVVLACIARFENSAEASRGLERLHRIAVGYERQVRRNLEKGDGA
jgi:hypothetical protein